MKFGFGHVPSEHYDKHVELVQLAEELAYDFAWIPDQTFYRDPYVIMAVLAQATDAIQIGVGVTNPYTRHPAMTARAVGTLDELAPGRIHLGIGAGNRKELLYPLGFDGSHSASKCREMVKIVRGLLSGTSFTFRGDHFIADDIGLNFEARPDIMCYVAGRGPLVLQAAGEVADGAIIGGLCTPAGIGYAMDQVQEGANRSGRNVDGIEVVSWVTCYVTEDRQSALEKLKPVAAHIIGGAPMLVLKAIDLPMDTIQAIKTTYKNEGIPEAAQHVTPECIDAFAIVGDSDECVRRIRRLEGAGVTQFSVLLPPGSIDQHKELIRGFAEAVFPVFK